MLKSMLSNTGRSAILFVFSATLFWSASVNAHSKIESAKFQTFEVETEKLLKNFKKERILLVYDIDNTLLTMKQDLGGDAWFTWQEGLLKTSPTSADLVAPNFTGLLDWQGVFFSLAKMIPTEAVAVEIFNKYRAKGFESLILTSRGPEFRMQTERELVRNGFSLGALSSLPSEPVTSYLPYEMTGTGLFPEAELQRLKVSSAKPVTLQKGIMMTSGQHKGVMLGTFLEKWNLQSRFDAVVFIDDHSKHTDRMHDAMAAHLKELVTIRYSFMDGQVDRFKKDQSQAKRDWQDVRILQQVLFE